MAEPTVTFDDYTFTNIQALSPHFGTLVTRNQRLPGLDGGFRNHGDEGAPNEIGSPSITVRLASENNPDAMYLKADTLLSLKWRGVKRLKYTPEGASSERFTFAEVTDVQLHLAPSDHTSAINTASVTFSVTEPAWYVLKSNAFIWGSSTWGGGDRWGGGTVYTLGAPSSEQSLTPGGSTWTYPRIWFQADKGSAEIWNPAIEVEYAGNLLGRVQWFGNIPNGSALEIDCRRKRVRLDGADSYANFETLRGYWLRFPPVQFTLRILSESSSNDGTVGVSYWEAYG